MSIYKNHRINLRQTYDRIYDNRKTTNEVSYDNNFETRRALSRAHVPPTKVFRRLVVNKTILKPRVSDGSPIRILGIFPT